MLDFIKDRPIISFLLLTAFLVLCFGSAQVGTWYKEAFLFVWNGGASFIGALLS